MKEFIIYTAFLLLIMLAGGCRNDFGELNAPPDKITEPQLNQLFTEALVQMYPHDYMEWFYNYSQYYLPWSQATVAVGGNRADMNMVGDWSPQENKLFGPKLQIEEIRYRLNEVYTPEQAAPYQYLKAICNPILVYLGLYGTDSYGSMAYSEASKSPYTSPRIITPKYESQQELFDVWLRELDETIYALTHPVTVGGKEYQQLSPGRQDFIYGGDYAKWARLANSLKLRIAVRMIYSDLGRALEIAKEVAKSPAGIMDGLEYDFIYNRGSDFNGFGNPVENLGIGSQSLIGFLVKNKDPRVRFLFAKNDFNSGVIQAFFDAGREVPGYILDQVEYTEEMDGKHFTGWKFPGEPWVRYYGAPVDIQAGKDPAVNAAYFNRENFKLTNSERTKNYQPLSLYNEEMVRGGSTYTFPSAPGNVAIQDNLSQPLYTALFSSAETALYLAELSLLGAQLPMSAEGYYRQGIELSVKLYDRLAMLNKIPYYRQHDGFDPLDETIALKTDEIAPLIEKYSLTGNNGNKLEQVFIQQYIHLLGLPNELMVTVRRSGYPRRGSALIGWEAFDSSDSSYPIPRRLPISSLNATDQMRDIKQASYRRQNLTPGANTPRTLADERLYYDLYAPAYGMGGH